jgi:small-conductance mechanosensitive channel
MGGDLWNALRYAVEQSVSIGLSLLGAVIVFLGAALLVRLLRSPVRRRLAATLAPENAKRLVENGVALGIYGAAATLLLTLWGVTWTWLLTAVGLSTLVVALGLQGALQSLVAGIFILFERPYNIGDLVRFSNHDIEGTVEEIALRTTIIRAEDGTRVVAPNSFVFTQAVINHSPDRAVLTIITVHGAGGSGRTPAETQALVEAAIADVPGFTARPAVVVRSRFAARRVPGWIARMPRLGAVVERLVRAAIDQTTQVRVSWSGFSDQVQREAVLRRLKDLFPGARIGVRRW